MKHSGIEWLGKIPEEWELERLRFHIKLNPSKSELRNYKENTIASFIPMEAVGKYGGINREETKTIDEAVGGYTYFKNNDVVVAKITPCFENGKGAIADNLSNGIGFGTTELHVLRPEPHMDSCFLFYLTISYPFRKLGEAEMKGAAGQKRVPEDFIRDLRHTIPSYEEQKFIASFLDRETEKIDALIVKKERQIELLKEKRSALISHAVTKGLNPNVKVKNYGIDWIGKIPEEWEVKKLKYISSIKFSNVDKHTTEGERPVRLCNYVDVYYNDYITGKMEFMIATATPAEISKFTLKEGDIIITKDSEAWEDIAIPAYVLNDLEGVLCGYHLAQIRPKLETVYSRFLFRSFCAQAINDQFKIAATGVTRFGLGKYWLDNSLFIVPPKEEQISIASFLDKEIEKIDSLIKKIQESIEKLREYRTALISAAVTGKIDVRKETA